MLIDAGCENPVMLLDEIDKTSGYRKGDVIDTISAALDTGQNATFTTLLMSTGLTFGTISALYGLTAHIIDRTQFSLLVTVVVLSAIIPTAIAQRWFSPPATEHPHLALPPEPSEILIGESLGSAHQ